MTDDERKSVLARTHPLYAAHAPSWQVQIDAFEGEGGFLDGTYLWPYPREEDNAFKERRLMARYHNYLETLIDLYVRFMFTQGVQRRSKNEEFNAWLLDVDGAGTNVSDYMNGLAALALVNGHVGGFVDKTQDEAIGPSKADDPSRVVASMFTAPSIVDWRFDRNTLSSVKLKEDAPQKGIAEKDQTVEECQYLLWDREGWARYAYNGALVNAGTPNLGLVPLAILRPRPSHLNKMLGRALISNANVIRALFNRGSEEDEVLRAQAFSVLTVELDTDAKVDEVRAQIGGTVGAAKALIVKGKVKYETPSQEVPAAIRANEEYLVHEIYRAAHVRFKKEGLAAESADSIRMQWTELDEMLQGMAKAMAAAEKQIARAWFAWQTPETSVNGFDAAQQAYDAAQVEVAYPDEFFLADLATDLEAWADGLSMNLGPTMAKRIKKKAVRRIDNDIPQDELAAIDSEIDGQDDLELNPTAALTQGLAADNGNPVPGAPNDAGAAA